MRIFARLGRALLFLRERQGRSQKSVAAAADITPPMLSAYENERAMPEVETLDRILGLGLTSGLEELRWALDVVNDRAATSPESIRAQRTNAATAEPWKPPAAAAAGPSPELAQASAELAKALFNWSQTLLESVAEASRRKTE